MSIPINIENLLNKQKVESNRIEFKKGWNPVAVYHSICAFANDIDNLGGGYILIGVEEKDGVAVRPVHGIPENLLDKIQKSMVGMNNMIEPYYMPRTSVEIVDGKYVMAIWVPTGINRPYTVPSDVTAKQKKPEFYVRNGTSSILAKGEILDELRDMASKVPFDMRGNAEISFNDIDYVLIKNHLRKIGSKLLDEMATLSQEDLLDRMDLLTGPVEKRTVRNVAAMMFCDHPYKFFPYTQVDVVTFPEGRVGNPNRFSEVTFKGDVPAMIKQTMDYLKSNVIKEYVIKPKNKAESIRFFNYPYQALEEAVVNAIYHRSYQEYEVVEIIVEPERISILSYAGPDRSISDAALKECCVLKSRRYRNHKLGDFLKELDLTEGRSTGIPTIQEELKKNGSPRASIETDEQRSYFLIEIPAHKNAALGLKNGQKMGTKKDINRQVVSKSRASHEQVDEQVANKLRTSCEQVGVCFDDYNTLYLLMSFLRQECSLNELIQKTGIKRHTLRNKNLIKLIDCNWVVPTKEKKNAKTQAYKLTPAGDAVLNSL